MARYGMVLDMSRCTGCQTCVVSCQLSNNLRPGVAWIDVKVDEQGKWPDSGRSYLPAACMHCSDAPCAEVCPTGATVKEENGVVTVDYDKCIGCWMCEDACPYGARKRSTEDAWFFGESEPAPYEDYKSHPVGISEKCDFCYTRLNENLQPACVSACPTHARIFGDLDDPSSEVSEYISKTSASQVPNSGFYYATGNYNLDVATYLVENQEAADARSQKPVTDKESTDSSNNSDSAKDKPQDKEEENGASPVAIGAGLGAIAVAAAGVGVAASRKKTKEANQAADKQDLKGSSADDKNNEGGAN